MNIKGLDFNMNFKGDCFVLFSAISYAVSSVLMKKYSKDENPVILSGYQFIIGGIFMIVVGMLWGGRVSFESVKGIGVLVYLGFLSAIAYSLWGILLKYNPVSRVTIFTFTTPVFGVILSKLMLSESGDVAIFNLIVTLVLVCSGILLLNYKKD